MSERAARCFRRPQAGRDTQAKFTTGSTMRHVVVMTATGSIGLVAVFIVDALNLFYISLLGQAELAAAIGYAGTLLFFQHIGGNRADDSSHGADRARAGAR
jgi:hypothetical protein